MAGLRITEDEAADALLDRDPLALLVGMLLDQQVPIEWAFAGPYKLAQRLGADRLEVDEIAGYDPEAFTALCAEPPAVHRFPGSMAKRIQALAAHIRDTYGSDPAAIWTTAGSGPELLRRLAALPGFGEQKARIFLALLGKQRGVRPRGWREACAPYGERGSHRSVADVVDRESLLAVRAFKQQQKRAAKAAEASAG